MINDELYEKIQYRNAVARASVATSPRVCDKIREYEADVARDLLQEKIDLKTKTCEPDTPSE